VISPEEEVLRWSKKELSESAREALVSPDICFGVPFCPSIGEHVHYDNASSLAYVFSTFAILWLRRSIIVEICYLGG
jgi:hypothetical protein